MNNYNSPYAPKVNKFTNSKEFSYLAEYFYKHKCYTTFPPKTLQHRQFWEEVRNNCINGFTNSVGIKITGQHFFYLNFVQILATDAESKKKRKKFPEFTDLDYEYFWTVDYAKKNEKSLVAVKARRQGWSYKAAAICTHEYSFFRESSCVIGAFLSDFSQQTMNMVIDNCNFLDRYTEFKKQRNPDTKEFFMSRYQVDVGGTKIWKGFHSKVESITYKSNEFAAVGKSATWLVLDEAGVFPNIVEAYGMSEPLIKDGNIYTGACLMFGSAGNMEAGSQYFKDIFVDPSKYNMLEFDNPKSPGAKIGFFSSAAKARWGVCRDPESIWFKKPMMDDEGNSNIDAAIDDILWERKQKKNSSNRNALYDFITQYPLEWDEAFLITQRSPFPITLAQERLAELETNKLILNSYWPAKLIMSDERVSFGLGNPDSIIREFPIKDNKGYPGEIEIFEQPYDDNPAFGIYIAGIDPYDDDSSGTNSLGSCFIMNTLTGRIVAEYTGRPDTAKEYYEICRRLIKYYNAVANYENNKKGLFAYFEQKNCLHMLCDTPKILKDQQITKLTYASGNNAKGTAATEMVNRYARELIKSWMLEQAVGKEEGVTNTHTIGSPALLKEMIYWNKDGNFDRISALGMCLILREDRAKIIYEELEEDLEDKLDFFTRNYEGKIKDPFSYSKPNDF